MKFVSGGNAGSVEKAALPGYALNAGPGGCFDARLQHAAGQVPGVLLEAPGDLAAARLRFFADVLGWQTGSAGILVRGQTRDAQLFRARDTSQGAPFDRPAWHARWGGLALAAADEILSYFGQVEPTVLRPRMPMILARAAARAAAASGQPTTLRSNMGTDQVEVVTERTAHSGFFLTRSYDLRHPKFDSTLGPEVRREVFVATDATIVLPYDAERDRVLLVEQFRAGPYGRGDPHPWMMEPVAGRVDAGESPADTAHRECREEAGIELKQLEHIASYYCSPGCSTEYFHCYLGLCELPVAGQGKGGLAAEHEDIRTHVLPFDTAHALLATGEADNGPLIMSLIWLAQERERLRASA